MNKYESGKHSIKLTDQPGNLIPLDRWGVPDLSVSGDKFGSAPNGVKMLHKKFQIFLTNERKVMPVLPKVSQSMFFGRHNTAATVRAKRP